MSRKKGKAAWPAWLAFGLAFLLLAEAALIQGAKSRQRLGASQLGPLLQAPELDRPLALACGPGGQVWLLEGRDKGWRLRQFDAQMEPLGAMDGAGPAPSALAVDPHGRALLAFEDGRALLAGSGLKRPLPLSGLPLSGIRAMQFTDQGTLLLLQLRARTLAAFTLKAGALERVEHPLASVPLQGAYTFTLGPGGLLCFAGNRKGLLEARCLDSRGRQLSAFVTDVEANVTHSVAADGEGRVYVNENVGGLGLSVWTREGRYLGKATHAGPLSLSSIFLMAADRQGRTLHLSGPGFLGRFEVKAWP